MSYKAMQLPRLNSVDWNVNVVMRR